MSRHRPPSSLRETLRSAVSARRHILWTKRSKRKDIARVWAAIASVERFLASYPVADDARVRSWCIAHRADVSIVVPGNKPTVLARLIMDQLQPTT